MLSSGSLLDNRYRLDERIATGGMGDVWRGTDVVLGRTIAVKVLRPAMLTDPEFAARFYGEARMMAAFRHPGVVEVYDYSAGDADDENRCAYLVMAFVDGEPLSARLKQQSRLGVAETMSIVAQAADALHAAHENGTVHRDVKPGNLIVKPNGAVILVDFGVARSAAVTSVTGLNAIVGTALYMAPEQVAKGNVTAATDIYALGAVAYHCIAGFPPFDGDNALQVALHHLEDDPEPLPESLAPQPVRDLIAKAMAKTPAARFASAAEFAEAALAAAGSLDWQAQTGTSLTRTALVRPAVTGAALSGPAVPGARTDGQSLTGTALTRPISPAAAGRTMPVQRNLLEAAPAAAPAPRRQSKSQLAVLFTVIVLFLLAGGLGTAIWLSETGENKRKGPAPAVAPGDSPPADETDEPLSPTEDEPTVAPPQQGGTQPQTNVPTKSTRPTAKPTATRPPTTVPTTSTTKPPVTDPTEPSEPPVDPEPTTTDDTGGGSGDGSGGDAGGDAGAGGANPASN
ncbi:serine/threonine-protein kinase [Couchioplanes caeruleus]|uniref:non-specific serine/threonine protein kinase n=2 Tax=Couchioplanes caeruleus TaxID=56438 RepID=A0A1K0GDM1_9ACTN|nr:serine/threonine-protein kinase [Couchioplanes caeruleus]OJF15330.1 serine/threonine protein kinase [Couchioplanes caeruleus subsp. caeruleus]ROP29467.1 serine/threonine-protein kinase [Couchioplanes caeruleus]